MFEVLKRGFLGLALCFVTDARGMVRAGISSLRVIGCWESGLLMRLFRGWLRSLGWRVRRMISVERAAMYLVRIARAEAYEAAVGY